MKKFLTWVCLAVILFAGVYASASMAGWNRTYEKAPTPVYELMQNPEAADENAPADGAAGAIVNQNLKNARAVNDVTSIVFDYRGFDTLGEASVLFTAVLGVGLVLRKLNAKEKREARDAEE